MIKTLIRIFVKNSDKENDANTRTSLGIFAGIFGIVCNLFLFIVKLIIGGMIGSIAIISDACNNLSDIGSSAVSLISAKISSHKPDREHPFGHGRIEYVCSLIVSFIIIFVGLELIKTSFSKILYPKTPILAPVALIILILSIGIKVWMYFSMRYIGRKIHSEILIATSKDSISDAIATAATVFSVVFCNFFPPVVDGITGMIVAFLICITGIRVAKNTASILLGPSPDPIMMQQITDILSSKKDIMGIHDLIIHDYGPGKRYASVHVEVPDKYSAMELHEIIDSLELDIFSKTGVDTVIHADPFLENCQTTNILRDYVLHVINELDNSLGMHDFRIIQTDNKNNKLLFDLEIPFSITEEDRKNILSQIEDAIQSEYPALKTVIRVDNKQ